MENIQYDLSTSISFIVKEYDIPIGVLEQCYNLLTDCIQVPDEKQLKQDLDTKEGKN